MPEIKEAIAIFILHENNMRCLHWNCVGHDFMTAHGVAEEYTEHICSDIDKLAEFNDILGNSPNQVNLIEAAKIIEESDKKLLLVDPSKYYSADDVYKCVTIILSDLKSVIEELLDDMGKFAEVDVDLTELTSADAEELKKRSLEVWKEKTKERLRGGRTNGTCTA